MKLPPYEIYPTISDNRVSLRQILPLDVADILEISFYESIQATTLQQAKEMQAKINKDYIDGNSIHWGITNKATNKLIGTCGYYRGFDKGAGELGCVLLPQFYGHGFMTNAMQLAIRFGINDIGLKRIWAITTQKNIKAIRLLDRLQFIKVADLDNDEIEYNLIP
jgi:ribosomal-protein-alanine N-acetyltransferase